MLKKSTLLIGLMFCAIAGAALAGNASPLQYLEWPMFGQNGGNTSTGLTLAIRRSNVGKRESVRRSLRRGKCRLVECA